MACSAAAGDRFSVLASTSTNTGTAPTRRIAVADATKVIGGTMTSSPEPIPAAVRAISSDTVPLAVAMPRVAPWSAENRVSSSPTTGCHPPHMRLSSTLSTAERSSSSTIGQAGGGCSTVGQPPKSPALRPNLGSRSSYRALLDMTAFIDFRGSPTACLRVRSSVRG